MARTQAQLLVRAAQRDKSGVGLIFRRRRRVLRNYLVGAIIFAASSIGYVAIELVHRRTGAEIVPGLFEIVDPMWLLLIPFFVTGFVLETNYARKYFTSLWAFRQSAISDDDLMAPVAPQPQPITGEEAQFISHSFAHIRWLDDPLDTRLMIRDRSLANGLLPIYFVGFSVLLPFVSGFWTIPRTIPVYWYIALPALIYVVVFTRLFVNRRADSNFRQGVFVHADEHGLTWRRMELSGSERRVAWDDLRSFAQLDFLTTPPYARQKWNTTFLLDAGSAILAWGYEPMPSVYGKSMTDETPDLARLIVTHTNLPLRDATPLVAEVVAKVSAVDGSYWQQILPPQKGARSAATIAGIDDVLRPPRAERLRAERLRAWAPVWLAFIPLVAYFVVVSVFMTTHP